MDACGSSELLLPAMQPEDLWVKSGRDKDMGEVMVRFSDRKGRKICLGPTHEEVITELIKNHVSSYRQLPLVLYQIQTKFRDEIRPRFGLIRACEFIMKDAYSFDKDESGLDKNYQAMYNAYKRIFKRCGLEFYIPEADSGIMGGKVSHEFMVPAEDGEDIILSCPQCKFAKAFSRPAIELEAGSRNAEKEGAGEPCLNCGAKMEKINAIEVGHIFKLGTKYSLALGANFLDEQGRQLPVIMGCYGIGVSRLIPAIVEQNYDREGIIWPQEVSPYKAIILPLDVTDELIRKEAVSIYEELETECAVEALLDDRDERAGVKFKDADLLGIPLEVVIGKESLKKGIVELKVRRGQKKLCGPRHEIISEIKRLCNV